MTYERLSGSPAASPRMRARGHAHLRVAAPPIRVLVADDDAAIRELLRQVISSVTHLEFVGAAHDAAGAGLIAAEEQPDIALIDVQMPGTGVRAARDVLRAAPNARVLALSISDEPSTVLEMLGAGAVGYLVKGMPTGEIIAAIERAARGESVLAPAAVASLVEDVAAAEERRRAQAAEYTRRVRDLQRLIARGFDIALQPIFDLDTQVPFAWEALARFPSDPDHGPGFWFAEATAVGLRPELELAAVGAAFTRLDELPPAALLTVNASPDPAILKRIHAIADRDTLARIVVEISEQSAVTNYEELDEALRPLRHAGARVAIDDAGAGFASLRHVLRIEPEIIKLDRSLTCDIDRSNGQRALAAALAAFAEETGATLVAEGVETAAELETLRRVGIRFAQGFYLGKPTTRRPPHSDDRD